LEEALKRPDSFLVRIKRLMFCPFHFPNIVAIDAIQVAGIGDFKGDMGDGGFHLDIQK